MAVNFNGNYLTSFLSNEEILSFDEEVKLAHKKVHEKTGLGNDFLGWVQLPTNYDKAEFERIKKCSEKIRKDSDILVVIGIGGSYLGARAAIELLKSPFHNSLNKKDPQIIFAGNNISPSYLNHILALCEGKDISVNVISKSGTTTEPAIAFRVFRELLENKYGVSESKKRIYCTTDKSKGTLKKLADSQGYETFVIPDNVGGRYSVLTPVGLLPIAVAGCNIDEIMNGARKAQQDFMCDDLTKNDCYKYAAVRNALHNKGKSIELLVSYEPSFAMMSEWYKQLFGESEGKDNKGIFPSSVNFSTDLHSMGQFIQDGTKNIFETVIQINNVNNDFYIKPLDNDFDGLNFLSNQNMSKINQKALEGTMLAHCDGGVPNIILELDSINEFNFGYLVYFFEKACAISGYILGVNPFDQPGVEAYKNNMYALLGRIGYEEQKEKLDKRLNNI